MVGNELVRTRADAAVLSRDFDLAVRLYSSLLAKSPNDIGILEKIGSIYVKSGNDKKALPFYIKINELKPNDFSILNDLGGIYRRLKLYDESIKVLKEAQKLNIDEARVNYNLGFTYKFMGEYDEAVSCFESVIQYNPNDVLAYNHLGSIYHSRGRIQKAIQTYLKGLKVDCNHPILHLNLAKSYEAENEISNAIVEYELALRSRPGWKEAIVEYSDLLIRINKTKEAKDLISQAILINPKDSKMYSTYGSILLKESDYEKAIDEYKKSLDINPSEKKSLIGIAEALEENGNSIDAIEYIEKVENENPDDLSVVKKSAEISLSANRTVAASNKIKKLLDLNSEDIESLDLAGQFFIIKDEDNKAENCYKKIEQINPAYVRYLSQASKRYKQKGNLQKAENYIRQYIAKSPNDSKAFVNLALISEALGRTNEALNNFRKALQINNNNAIAKKSLLRISDYLTDALEDNQFNYDTQMNQIDENLGEEEKIVIDQNEEVNSQNENDLILTDEEIPPMETDLWKSESWDPDSIVEEVEDPLSLLDGNDESISVGSLDDTKEEESIDNIEEEMDKNTKEMPSVLPLENLVDSISEPQKGAAVLGEENKNDSSDDYEDEDLFGESDLLNDSNKSNGLGNASDNNDNLDMTDDLQKDSGYLNDESNLKDDDVNSFNNSFNDDNLNSQKEKEFDNSDLDMPFQNQNYAPEKNDYLDEKSQSEKNLENLEKMNAKALSDLKDTLNSMKTDFSRQLAEQAKYSNQPVSQQPQVQPQSIFPPQQQEQYSGQGISTSDAMQLMENMLKTQNEANKAMAAAEKAWMAAGQAADAAQVAQVAESALTDMASDVVMQASEEIRKEAEIIAKEATEKALAEKMQIIDNVLPKFEELLQKADDVQIDDSPELQQALLLFKSLRELGENLPDEAKEEFLRSSNRVRIDYIINRLSGNSGLLKVAQNLRDNGTVENYVKDSELPIDCCGKKLARKVLTQMSQISEELEDKYLVEGLNKVVLELMNKI